MQLNQIQNTKAICQGDSKVKPVAVPPSAKRGKKLAYSYISALFAIAMTFEIVLYSPTRYMYMIN